jgi:Flp pilus assembly pilin Flp
MLAGNDGARSADPYATGKSADNHRIVTGPDIMVFCLSGMMWPTNMRWFPLPPEVTIVEVLFLANCTDKASFKEMLKFRGVMAMLYTLWSDDQGQDIAEYAVMLAVILIIVVGTIRLIGSNANTVFSNVASAVQ